MMAEENQEMEERETESAQSGSKEEESTGAGQEGARVRCGCATAVFQSILATPPA